MAKKSENIYQIKITLERTKPSIWRKVLIEPNMKLPDLHKVIQTVMGWTNSHLHQFIMNREYYSLPFEDGFGAIDYRKIKFNDLITIPKQKIIYEYDFGDGWRHALVLEKILPREPKKKYPVCIGGKRNCPPEDCGGVWGYEELLSVINDPEHEEHEDMMEWLGEEFDPEYFNLDEVNSMLQLKDYGCITIDF